MASVYVSSHHQAEYFQAKQDIHPCSVAKEVHKNE